MIFCGPAFAQDTSAVLLNVTFLPAPTDWCPADAGVPMAVTMDGPDIIQGPEDLPRTVKVRRGSDVTFVNGENINSFNRAEDFIGPSADVIGRFSAEFQSCFSAFGDNRANGKWTLKSLDGAIADSGPIEDQFLYFPLNQPFLERMAGPSGAYSIKFDDRRLYVAGGQDVQTTQIFRAEPDKE